MSNVIKLFLVVVALLLVQDIMRANQLASKAEVAKASAAAATAAASADTAPKTDATHTSSSSMEDLAASSASSQANDGDAMHVFSNADAPEHLLRPSLGRRVHVSFCSACAYNGQFQQLKEALDRRFPGMTIVGSNYPLSTLGSIASTALTGVQFGGMALLMAGDKPWQYLNMPMPALLEQAQGSWMGVSAFLMYGCNMIKSFISSNGAFEVAYDGQLVYSKLHAAGQAFPSHAQIIKAIDALENRKSAY